VAESLSTLDDVRPVEKGSAAQWGRGVGIAALLVVVVLGATGFFGVRSRTTTVASDGYSMSVTYPQSARAGLDVPWRVRIHHPGGFPKQITLAVTRSYFHMFETQGWYPDADSASSDGTFIYFVFDTQPGSDDFVVDYDTYIQPGSQLGKSADVKLIIAGRLITTASLRTWLLP
jgi:hypothetical protein